VEAGENRLSGIKARVQINAPFDMLWEHYLPLFLAEQLNPEIGLDAASLDRFSRRDFTKVADQLRRAGRQITLHGPFQDLLPGALDSRILAASRARLQDAFDLLEVFQPVSIVCHIGYEARHYQGVEERWLTHSVATWEPLAEQAARFGTLLTLENVYETQPALIKELLTRLQAPNIRFCLDVGHLQAFGGGDFPSWLAELGSFVGQLHLHDNNGEADEHLALGQGIIPIPQVLDFFAGRQASPILTLEPHHENSLWPSLDYLRSYRQW
jgi:sugar phosphate isomerase/epimerase